MRMAFTLVPLSLLAASTPAHAQVVSCTAVCGDRAVTLELTRRGQEASRALRFRLEPAVASVEDALERGVLSDLEGHPQPAPFREALQKLQEVEAAAQAVDERLAALESTHKQDRPLAVFDDALKKLLRDRPLGPSRGLRGAVRHAHATAGAPPVEEPASLSDILRLQRADLAEVRRAFAELAEAVGGALPLAGGKGLAAASLGGRVPLLSAAQAAVERWEAYRAFTVESCRATQAAAAQVYPTGMEWLEEQEPAPHQDPR